MAAFYLGGTTKCPKCGNHDFAGPTQPSPGDKLICKARDCGYVCTIEEAQDAARTEPKSGGSENFVDK
jgi:hypothetical protein